MNASTQISTANAIALPVIIVRDGGVFANSRDVAAFFDKRHADVIRAIDELLAAAPEAEREFALCPYSAVSGGREYRSFDLTREGFTLLAMGFTGPRARCSSSSPISKHSTTWRPRSGPLGRPRPSFRPRWQRPCGWLPTRRRNANGPRPN